MFRNTYQKLRFKAAARNPIFLRNGAKFIAQIVTLVEWQHVIHSQLRLTFQRKPIET